MKLQKVSDAAFICKVLPLKFRTFSKRQLASKRRLHAIASLRSAVVAQADDDVCVDNWDNRQIRQRLSRGLDSFLLRAEENA